MSKTVREILENLIRKSTEFVLGNLGTITENDIWIRRTDIDQALEEINAYYKSKVPKKKEICNCPAHRAYNQCVDDFHKEG